MIYVHVYYKANEQGSPLEHPPHQVVIIFPDKPLPTTINPHNGHLSYEEGIYNNRKGFYPQDIEINGSVGGEHSVITLPKSLCAVFKHLPS